MIDVLNQISGIDKQLKELKVKKKELLQQIEPELINLSAYKTNDVLPCGDKNYMRIINIAAVSVVGSVIRYNYLTVDLYGDYKTISDYIDFPSDTELK